MKCPKCGKEAKHNFCKFCGTKVKKVCDCWLKKSSYDCGEPSCPGYKLLTIEKSKSN